MEPTGMSWFPVAHRLADAGIDVARVKGKRVKALRRYLGQITEQPEGLSSHDWIVHLRPSGQLRPETVADLQMIFKQLDRAKFAPRAADAMDHSALIAQSEQLAEALHLELEQTEAPQP
jgi:hypothetical protein